MITASRRAWHLHSGPGKTAPVGVLLNALPILGIAALVHLVLAGIES